MAKKAPRQLSLFSNIQMHNLTIDKSLTVKRLGRNGILYEYRLPYGANPMNYYKEAVDVRSIKGNNTNPTTKKGKEGYIYRTGMYQPIGDKRYFTYYQIHKMLDMKSWDKYIEDLMRRHDERMLKKLADAVIRGVFDELQQ